MHYTAHYDSPLGGVTLGSDGRALTGLWFDGQKYFAATLDPEHEARELPVFSETKRWLNRYFSGSAPDFTPPLRLYGTDFQKSVWEALLAIPYGQTVTYGELAAKLAERRGIGQVSARAVGGAVGRNAVSLIIPCHRVVGANGALTGYAGGLDRKIRLLEREGLTVHGAFVRPR
jgi:methylated-DNA-[protein]-cysteine S-methyltransferase